MSSYENKGSEHRGRFKMEPHRTPAYLFRKPGPSRRERTEKICVARCYFISLCLYSSWNEQSRILAFSSTRARLTKQISRCAMRLHFESSSMFTSLVFIRAHRY